MFLRMRRSSSSAEKLFSDEVCAQTHVENDFLQHIALYNQPVGKPLLLRWVAGLLGRAAVGSAHRGIDPCTA